MENTEAGSTHAGAASDDEPAERTDPANLGLYDGAVGHDEVNGEISLADKVILFGEQTRLPYFPEDRRLGKLHAGDPLVLLFWKVFKKIPESLREALLGVPFSITLVRGDNLLFFAHVRRHQALHIGRRRRTVYLPEALLHAAEEHGYDYWSVAEGIIYGAWMLLDYLLLADLVRAFADRLCAHPGHRLGEVQQRRLLEELNHHRRASVEEPRSEVAEFVDGYRERLARLGPEEALGGDCHDVARRLFDPDLEHRWAHDKMVRIADVFNYPQLFLFDRDIIHGTAREIALRRGQDVAARTFADVLHDYRDELRFEPRPPLTTLGRTVLPKPRARALEQIVVLGAEGLRGFFAAYRQDLPDVRELMHPLWMYLCSLSSDPAGVFSRVGRCRAVGREGLEVGMEGLLAGILIRLDRAPGYERAVREVASMGAAARRELAALIRDQRLGEDDDLEPFKIRKQIIVARACQVLEEEGGQAPRRPVDLHRDARIQGLLEGSPHRLTSDPSAVLMYLRAYRRSLTEFGPDDPDSDYLLAALLVRLDRSEYYAQLGRVVEALGTPALSALHGVFEQIPERDAGRRAILEQARAIWARMLLRMGSRALEHLSREEPT